MTPEAQRIAIAEACGWRDCYINQNGQPWGFNRGLSYSSRLPDYLSDLNAMHEAERELDDDQYLDFMRYLTEPYDAKCNWSTVRYALEATAAQHAKAFLHAIGKWKQD